jgi:hypothetical protein
MSTSDCIIKQVMRWWTIAVLVTSGSMSAQLTMPVGIVRGAVVGWNGSSKSGELAVRGSADTIFSCLYDARTYIERDHQTIAMTALAAGDPVEVLADHKPGSPACYTRIVYVTRNPSRLFETQRSRLRPVSSSTESLVARGTLTFGGVVMRTGFSRMTIKMRTGEVTVVLRPDTRYVCDGFRVDASTPLVNKHIFLRAGHDLDGGLEAYQVFWSDTMTPK